MALNISLTLINFVTVRVTTGADSAVESDKDSFIFASLHTQATG